MEQNTLQQALKKQYGIAETLLVEGTFVAYNEDNMAESMVAIGLSHNSLFIASLIFSGTKINYSLTSIKPLLSLTVHIISCGMKLNISSASKKVKLYQLCSSPNQIKIWAKFVAFLSTLPLNKIQYSTLEKQQQDDAEKVRLANEIESAALPEISNPLHKDSDNNTKTTKKTTTTQIRTSILGLNTEAPGSFGFSLEDICSKTLDNKKNHVNNVICHLNSSSVTKFAEGIYEEMRENEESGVSDQMFSIQPDLQRLREVHMATKKLQIQPYKIRPTSLFTWRIATGIGMLPDPCMMQTEVKEDLLKDTCCCIC